LKATKKMTKHLKIGIIGVGMVGGTVARYFESIGRTPFLYDKYNGKGSLDEVNEADAVFICVPTPYGKGGFDLSMVEEAVSNLENGKIVVVKSTVLPGTTESLQNKYPQHQFLFNPEFLRELTAVEDMLSPERQIVGYTEKSQPVAEEILEILPPAPFKKTIPATEAEMVKYFGNTYLAARVIFANQMYDLCQALGIDYDKVRECAGEDKRIGHSHLDVWQGGYRGYGAKCFPKDIRALIQLAEMKGVDLKFHKLVEDVNRELAEGQQIDDMEKLRP